MTQKEMDFIGSLNMCDEISNEAYKKIMAHCEEQEPCEDCISRQAAIDAITRDGVRLEREGAYEMMICTAKQWAVDLIDDLPSVTPERKKGKWIDRTSGFTINLGCDQCGEIVHKYGCRFCPNCGSYNGGELNGNE